MVTANKRVENIRDVPSSISVIGEEKIDNFHATQLSDFQATVPGLAISSNGAPGQDRGVAARCVGLVVQRHRRHVPRRNPAGLQRRVPGRQLLRARPAAVRHPAHRSAARTAGHPVRRQHDGRPDQVRHRRTGSVPHRVPRGRRAVQRQGCGRPGLGCALRRQPAAGHRPRRTAGELRPQRIAGLHRQQRQRPEGHQRRRPDQCARRPALAGRSVQPGPGRDAPDHRQRQQRARSRWTRRPRSRCSAT